MAQQLPCMPRHGVGLADPSDALPYPPRVSPTEDDPLGLTLWGQGHTWGQLSHSRCRDTKGKQGDLHTDPVGTGTHLVEGGHLQV